MAQGALANVAVSLKCPAYDATNVEMLLEILLAVREMHQKVFQQSKMELEFIYNVSRPMLEMFHNGIFV